jgi:hypothetical protein
LENVQASFPAQAGSEDKRLRGLHTGHSFIEAKTILCPSHQLFNIIHRQLLEVFCWQIWIPCSSIAHGATIMGFAIV